MSSLRQPISLEILNNLITDKAPESSTLEFKRDLPSRNDKDKAEFLKDVTAFANADGGDLIYGISEANGCAEAIHAIKTEGFDDSIRRLGQILDAGVEPRLLGVRFDHVAVEEGYVLRLRILPAIGGPHRYLFNGHSKFVTRNGTHIAELSYGQLQSAFDKSATLAEQARKSWEYIVERIASNRTWKPMGPGPICLVRLTPLSAMSGRAAIDMKALYNDFTRFMFSDWSGGSRAFNLDGLVVYPGTYDQMPAYVQIHRTGCFDGICVAGHHWENRKILPSTLISVYIREAVLKFLSAAKNLDILGPAIVNVAILNVEEYALGVGGRYYPYKLPFADRNNLVLPEMWIDQIASFEEPDSVIQPILDVMWQSFGMTHCSEYNDSGEWNPRSH